MPHMSAVTYESLPHMMSHMRNATYECCHVWVTLHMYLRMKTRMPHMNASRDIWVLLHMSHCRTCNATYEQCHMWVMSCLMTHFSRRSPIISGSFSKNDHVRQWLICHIWGMPHMSDVTYESHMSHCRICDHMWHHWHYSYVALHMRQWLICDIWRHTFVWILWVSLGSLWISFWSLWVSFWSECVVGIWRHVLVIQGGVGSKDATSS